MKLQILIVFIALTQYSFAQNEKLSINVFDSVYHEKAFSIDHSRILKLNDDTLTLKFWVELYSRDDGPQEHYVLTVETNYLDSLIKIGKVNLEKNTDLINRQFELSALEKQEGKELIYKGDITFISLKRKRLDIEIKLQIEDIEMNKTYIFNATPFFKNWKKH